MGQNTEKVMIYHGNQCYWMISQPITGWVVGLCRRYSNSNQEYHEYPQISLASVLEKSPPFILHNIVQNNLFSFPSSSTPSYVSPAPPHSPAVSARTSKASPSSPPTVHTYSY